MTDTINEPKLSYAAVVYGVTLVALEGIRQERIQARRARCQDPEDDYTKDADYQAVALLINELRNNNGMKPVYTRDRQILDNMAFVCQTMRLDRDLWAKYSVVRKQEG